MLATNTKDMRIDEFLPQATRSIGHFKEMRRAIFLFSTILGLALLLVCTFGCAPSSSSEGDGKPNQSAPSSSTDAPELTEEIIRERINRTRVRQIPEENGAGEPISWSFYEEEPKELIVVEKQIEGNHATVVIDIKTRSTPKAREPRYLAGQIRTKWDLRTGWALRQWEILETENISMKYKNLPKPPAQNSNR